MTIVPLKPGLVNYSEQLDRVKFVAILFVILLHELPKGFIRNIASEYHIKQAVPIFMILAGITACISESRRKEDSLALAYSPLTLLRRVQRILIPFTLVWIAESLWMAFRSNTFIPSDVITYWFQGGLGHGSYFTPVYLQHLLLFPLISAIYRQTKTISLGKRVVLWLLASIAIDISCLNLGIPEEVYRVFVGRYIFAIVLGIILYNEKPSRLMAIAWAVIGFIYITSVTHLELSPRVIHPEWGCQQAPAYFYTAALLLLLWHAPAIIKTLSDPFMILGRASYHVFLTQMVYFWKLRPYIDRMSPHPILTLACSLTICCSAGLLFYLAENKCRETVRANRNSTKP